MRKTSKDYKNDLKNLRQSLASTEAHIKDRLIHLVNEFPEAIVVEKGVDKFKAKYVTKLWIDRLSVDTMVDYISAIERHNAKEESVRQLTISV